MAYLHFGDQSIEVDARVAAEDRSHKDYGEITGAWPALLDFRGGPQARTVPSIDDWLHTGQAIMATGDGLVLMTTQGDFEVAWPDVVNWDGAILTTMSLGAIRVILKEGGPSDSRGFTEVLADPEAARRAAALPASDPSDKTADCPDCGGTVSRRATTCVHCGAPLGSSVAQAAEATSAAGDPRNSTSKDVSKGVFWGVLRLLLLLGGLVLVLYGCYASSSGR